MTTEEFWEKYINPTIFITSEPVPIEGRFPYLTCTFMQNT
jgi:hypothetical protein